MPIFAGAGGVAGVSGCMLMARAVKSSVGTWARLWDGGTNTDSYENTSQALNDELVYDIYLAAGTYTFFLECLKTSSSGIVTVYIDGTSVGTIDNYAGSTALAGQSIASIAVTASGKHELKLKEASKNASASAYHLYLIKMGLMRTA